MELTINQNNGKGYKVKTLASGRDKSTLLNRVEYGRQMNQGKENLLPDGSRNPDFLRGQALKRSHSEYLILEGGEATANLAKVIASGKVLVQGVTETAKGIRVDLMNKDKIDPSAVKAMEAKARYEAQEKELAEYRIWKAQRKEVEDQS